ncbi:hypothetical protein II906_09675 [bacterium]|nr:hypothetical protein [bacterium]
MSKKIFQAKIYAKCGGSPIQMEVEANDSYSAKKEIENLWYFRSFYSTPAEIQQPTKFKARIYLNTGSGTADVIVFANDSYQAKQIIEMRPDFKSFSQSPYKL